MKIRRIVTLVMAAYALWKRLSPQQRASARRQFARLTGKPVNAASRSAQ